MSFQFFVELESIKHMGDEKVSDEAEESSIHFVARFDVARYYESMQHDVLLATLRQMGSSAQSISVVKEYLQKPDVHATGVGMNAGGCLSPLLGAVMLTPLDDAMTDLMRKEGIVYVRYMEWRPKCSSKWRELD